MNVAVMKTSKVEYCGGCPIFLRSRDMIKRLKLNI